MAGVTAMAYPGGSGGQFLDDDHARDALSRQMEMPSSDRGVSA
jgi:hypothetical protein